MSWPTPQRLTDLALDLQVEWSKLSRLVASLDAAWCRSPACSTVAAPMGRNGTVSELQELLRFRHLVRHLYAYELRPEPVERLRVQALALWPAED
jgi:hypothetical protein